MRSAWVAHRRVYAAMIGIANAFDTRCSWRSRRALD
jgi:hypothetical protein